MSNTAYNSVPVTNASFQARVAPTAGNGIEVYLPFQGLSIPASVTLSDTANTKDEVSVSSPADLTAKTAQWSQMTSAVFMSIPSYVTAVRFTNTGSGSVRCELAQ